MDLEKLALEAEENLKDIFADIDRTAYQNTARVIDSFREHRVDESCFAGTSGYGHDDKGRDTLDAIYADVFGAESVCAGQVASHVYIHTVEKSKILMLDFAALLSEKTFSCSCRMQVTTNLMQEFARQVMFFNSKIRILSQKKLRDKLKIYLQTLEIAPDGTVCLPYSRRELSEYLYADRSALSRELCKMRDEGILNFSGSRLQILDPDFLAI